MGEVIAEPTEMPSLRWIRPPYLANHRRSSQSSVGPTVDYLRDSRLSLSSLSQGFKAGARLRFAHPGIRRLRLRVRSKREEPEGPKLRPSAPESEIGPGGKFLRGIGQVETDELYVGVDTMGCQSVIPVQAKGRRDALNIVQIE